MLFCKQQVSLLLALLLAFVPEVAAFQKRVPTLNEEAARYLEFLREELAELDFQLDKGEISRPLYQRAVTKIEIIKGLVIRYGKADNQRLPEFHVLTSDDLQSFIPDGLSKLKQAKKDQIIDGKWRYLGKTVKRETFYMLERLD
ncbi:MAG: hypothetical protein JNN15_05145 [Blastocatellia bacterium]|nr:hypothetical protein [Blastocatellia bacterium]